MITRVLPRSFSNSDPAHVLAEGGQLYQGSPPEDWDAAWRELDVIVSLISYPNVKVPSFKLCIQWPIEDEAVPDDRATLWYLVRLIANLVYVGRKVLVHCGAGLNRSGFICALVCRELLRCSGSQAFDYVRATLPGSLLNPYFNTFLNQLGGLK